VQNKRVVIDGGHTPLAAEYLHDHLSKLNAHSARIVVGMLREKLAADTLQRFDVPHFTLVATTVPSNRAMPAHDLAAAFSPSHAQIEVIEDYALALAQVDSANEDVFAVFGSFRLAAAAREAFGLLSEAELEEAGATRDLFEGEGYQGRIKP
jgi:folylpolyglutamate synthase/dihydropteroate synthase